MFLEKLTEYIKENSSNYHTDNFSFARFGEPERDIINTKESYENIFPYLYKLSSFYNRLADEASKQLLIQLVAFRILGHRKVKLPLSVPEYWEARNNLELLSDKNSSLLTGFKNWKIYLNDLMQFHIHVKVYTSTGGVMNNFLLNQYDYTINDTDIIKAEKGDIVIDAGGCWGDTSLYFANEIGEEGKVYTFEFIPQNLDILKMNLGLNPLLKNQIEIVEKPLWDKTGLPMYYVDNGPGSQVSFNQLNEYSGIVNSISIDDFLANNKLDKVDFIKMDIEGAEPFALKGAINTIKKYKPKMAIAIYHNMDDFSGIIHQINDLGLGYRFYLDHYTIYHEETVLYCKAQ